ncbi:MAG: response regulator [Chitinophagaceae bacterium]|nr:response regulator [Chitinophagaceae bacterium]
MNNSANILKAAIVDDETDLCFLLKSILKEESVDAVEINTIEEAKTELPQIQPNVIFLDNHLPDGRGIDFIVLIKKNIPGAKVIMMTAFNAEGEEDQALKNGADCFLIKPLSHKTINEALARVNLR